MVHDKVSLGIHRTKILSQTLIVEGGEEGHVVHALKNVCLSGNTILSHYVKFLWQTGHRTTGTPIRTTLWVPPVPSVLLLIANMPAFSCCWNLMYWMDKWVCKSQMLTLQQSIEKQADHLTCSSSFAPMKNKGNIFISSITIIDSLPSMSTRCPYLANVRLFWSHRPCKHQAVHGMSSRQVHVYKSCLPAWE